MDASTVLAIEGLSKRYQVGRKVRNDIWALNDVSLEVSRGTILGVIGPNGAGKTTLLKVIARVTPPTSGRVRGRGRVIPLLALGAGFQADLSGRENIALNAAIYGVSRAEVEQRLDDIVAFAEIGAFIDVPVKRYSSGMYLRLAFAVAINLQPDLLLADEVLAVGDLVFQERSLERVRRAGEEGMSVLFVSHDMDAIQRLCHRVLWLHEGRIVRIGTPAEVVGEYQSAAWTQVARSTSRKGAHSSPGGEILFVKLAAPGGMEIGAARVQDDIEIQIGLRVMRAGAFVRPKLDLFARGILVFRSVAPVIHDLPEPGEYVMRVKIPGHLLADQVYSVNVQIGLGIGDENLSVALDNALVFQVYDTDSSAQGSYRGSTGHGVVRPRLVWEVPGVPSERQPIRRGAKAGAAD